MTSAFAREVSTGRLRDGDHLAYTYPDESRLADAISEFVRRGITRNQTNILLITKAEADVYLDLLSRSGLEVDTLTASGMLVIETVDQWLLEEDLGLVIDRLREQLTSYSKTAREQKRTGLNIIGTIANDLAKHGKQSDCLLLEAFWHRTIDQSEIPITLFCPYESMAPELEGPLQQTHSSMTRVVGGSAEKVARIIDEVIEAPGSDTIDSIGAIQDVWEQTLMVPLERLVTQTRNETSSRRVRIITSIEAGNLANARKMVATPGIEIRHIEGVRARLLVTRNEFLTTTRSLENGLPIEVIWSNGPELIGQMQSVFETLWESAVPAEIKIEELERGQRDGQIKLTFDSEEVRSSGERFAGQMKHEALVIVPGEENLRNNLPFFQKLAARARDDGVRVKILGDFSRDESQLIHEYGLEGVTIRRCSIRPSLALGIYDRNAMSLAQFIRSNDSKRDGSIPLSGVISTNVHAVAGLAGIFDALWDESELREREEKANRQTRLLQDILTHDLRNYSQVTMVNAELLKESVGGSPQTDLIAERLLKSIAESTRLIDKANQLGKIASETNPGLEAVELISVIEQSMAVVAEERQDRKISFSVKSSAHKNRGSGPIRVKADGLLREAFWNLFSNSASYSSRDRVRISVRVQDGVPSSRSRRASQPGPSDLRSHPTSYVKISVVDWSDGIRDEMKEKVFSRYLMTAKGHGLGLSIVRALVVERYGGKISIKNRVEGDHAKGTKIELWLRRA